MAKYKVGDKVRVIANGERDKTYYMMDDKGERNSMVNDMLKLCGKVVTIKSVMKQYTIEECFYLWTDEMFEGLAEEEAKPTPTPVVNVNVTVNLYENSCWYCRKGGLVDMYLAGAMGICPSCGRVCNDVLLTQPKFNNAKRDETPKRENKPLTIEELRALPDGTRVFTVWNYLEVTFTRWRVKRGNTLYWEEGRGHCRLDSDSIKAYLEEPERPV